MNTRGGRERASSRQRVRGTAGVPFRGPVLETGRWTRYAVVVLTSGAIAYLAFHALVSVFLALHNATAFNGYAMDGAFQLYNPLRRLADGQTVGSDFPFFHGVGVPVLHYPLFALLGGGVFAAEMARWIISPLMFGVTGFIFFRLLLGNWQRATIALALYLAIVIPRVNNIIDPGNSLMGIRTMTPLVIAAALLAVPRWQRLLGGFIQVSAPLLVAYLFIGVAVCLGTEQGVAAAGAFLLVRAVLNLRRLGVRWRFFAQTAVDVAAVASSIFLVLSVITLGHPIDALHYALIDVPADQGWVFGSVPNVTFTWAALLWEIKGGPSLDIGGEVPRYWLTAICAVILLVVAGAMRLVTRRELSAFSFLWIYGLAVLVSMLGYINLADQLAPFGRVSAAIAAGLAVMIMLTLLARAERRFAARPAFKRGRARIAAPLVGAATVVVLAVVVLVHAVPARADQLASIPKRSALESAIRGPWQDYDVSSSAWRGNLDQFAPLIPEGATIWSTYSSLYESTRGTFNPAPGGEDYIIHALGEERRAAYQEAFATEAPDAVITMNPFYSFYEEWLWNRYPMFYSELLTGYRIASISGSHILWLPTEDQVAMSPASEAGVNQEGRIELPANLTDRLAYYEVTVRYEADGGPVPVVNRLPRYYLLPENTALGLYGLALPPAQQEWTLIIPVLPHSGPVALTPTIAGVNRWADLTIESAAFRVLDVPAENEELAMMNFCFWKAEDARCVG